MQGKKYPDEIKEKAYALLAAGNSYAYVAKEIGVPASTINGWRRQRSNAELEENLVELRAKKKKEFVNKAWRSIELSQSLLERKLQRALEQEKQIDEMLVLVDQMASKEGMTQEMRRGLLSKIALLHCDDLGKIAQVLGVLYDKQALACKEETEIVGGSVVLRRFEDL